MFWISRTAQRTREQADDFFGHLAPVAQVAERSGKPLNAFLLQQDQQQATDKEVIGPVDLRTWMIRKHAPHRVDELKCNGVEHVLDDAAASFPRVADFAGDQPCIEKAAALFAQFDPGTRQRVEHFLDGGGWVAARHERPQLGDALARDRIDPALEYRAVKAVLCAEIVADEGELHAGRRCDFAHRNAVDAPFREQALGGVQNAVFRPFAVSRGQRGFPRSQLIRRLINYLVKKSGRFYSFVKRPERFLRGCGKFLT